MSNDSFKVKKSLVVSPVSGPTLTEDGEIAVDSSTNKLKVRLNGTTDTVSTDAGTKTLTNTTFDADGTGNSITNIENADIKAAAAIALNKLAATTASRALVSDASGFVSAAATTATELGYVSGVTSAIQTQINALSSGSSSAKDLINLGLSCSVGSSALTIALKQADGSTDPASGTGAVKIGLRSSTATSGAYNQRSVTGALSVVVSSGSTLGHISAVNRYIYVYAIDNAGTVELAVSSKYYDGGSIVSTTAEGGAGAADVNSTIYSTTARSNVPIRCIGRLKSNQTTAGTWAAAPTEVSVGDSWNDLEKSTITLDAHAGFGSTATKVAYFTNSTVVGTAMTLTSNDSTNGAKITINEPGLYSMMYMARYGASAEEYIGIGLNATVTTGVTTLTAATRLAASGNVNVAGSGNCILCAATTWPLNVDDVITPHHTIPTTPGTTSVSTFRIVKVSQNSVV